MPIGDSFNHSPKSSNTIDMINKRLHITESKIYGYHFNFDGYQEEGQDHYNREASKFRYDISLIYANDGLTAEH